ncbi:unnamed protein product [Arctogadus glacialis]
MPPFGTAGHGERSRSSSTANRTTGEGLAFGLHTLTDENSKLIAAYLQVIPNQHLIRLLLGHHALPPIKSYYYVDQKLNWTDAQQHCREQNGDLATVDNVADLQHLQESRTGFNYDDDFMWIGLYDDRTRWKWSHGDQDYKVGQNYGTWNDSTPDFWDNKENCTGFSSTGIWFDVSCYSLYYAVCFDDPRYIVVLSPMTWYKALQHCRSKYTDLASVPDAAGNLKQRSTFKIKISSEADMTDPEVERQILEQLHAKLAELGVTGTNISWVLKDGQVFHKDQPSET